MVGCSRTGGLWRAVVELWWAVGELWWAVTMAVCG